MFEWNVYYISVIKKLSFFHDKTRPQVKSRRGLGKHKKKSFLMSFPPEIDSIWVARYFLFVFFM